MVKYDVTPLELKTWREQNGYSQMQLAEVLGVTNVCVSRWENGAREIPSFLHLALECMETKKGGERKKKQGSIKPKKKKERRK